MLSPKGSSQPRNRACISSVSCIAAGFFTCWAIREAYVYIYESEHIHTYIHMNEWKLTSYPLIIFLSLKCRHMYLYVHLRNRNYSVRSKQVILKRNFLFPCRQEFNQGQFMWIPYLKISAISRDLKFQWPESPFIHPCSLIHFSFPWFIILRLTYSCVSVKCFVYFLWDGDQVLFVFVTNITHAYV